MRSKRTVSDEELIQLWHNNQPIMTVATALGISVNTLAAHWLRLKRAQLVPTVKRPVLHEQEKYYPESHDTNPPLLFEDRLLDKLLEVHGNPEQKK
jgi:hypothetical protein